MGGQGAAQDKALKFALFATVLLGVALRLLAYNPWHLSHADEFQQYLEQGHRLAEGYGIVPWEMRSGARNALVPQLLAGPIWLGAAISPLSMLPIHLARLIYMALCLLALAGAWGIGAARSRRHALVTLFVAAVWYESVLFSVQLLSESAATALLVCGAALLLVEQAAVRQLRLAGFLLVVGVLVRLQYAPFAAVLVLASARRDARTWRALAAGGSLALALGAASDMLNHQLPFHWIYANFAMNIGAGKAAQFGESGPLEYIRMLLVQLGPLGLGIIVAPLLSPPRYRPLVAAVYVNIAVHSLIGHKEYRFIWLSSFLLVVLSSIVSLDYFDRLVDRRHPGREAGLSALLLLCLGWLGASLLAERMSGGEGSFRGGGFITITAHEIAARPEICGLSVPLQWRNHVVSAYLRRNIPIYIAPDPVMAGKAALPPEIARAANAMLSDRQLPLAPDYRLVTCHTMRMNKACLFIRPGGCDRSAGQPYEIQTFMLKHDL